MICFYKEVLILGLTVLNMEKIVKTVEKKIVDVRTRVHTEVSWAIWQSWNDSVLLYRILKQ